MKPDTSPVNMTKENRAELKQLRARARLLQTDAKKVEGECTRECKRLVREAEKTLTGIQREAKAIEARRLILTGRLAK